MYNLTKVMYKPHKRQIDFLLVLHPIILSKTGLDVNEIIWFSPLFPPYKQYQLSVFVHFSHNICQILALCIIRTGISVPKENNKSIEAFA